MMLNTLKKQWELYEHVIPFDTIAERFKLAQAHLPEQVEYLLPSVILAKDGPVVRSLFLFTPKYMCELRLGPQKHHFDVMLLTTIRNYRVELDTQELVREEPPATTEPGAQKQVIRTTYETAKIVLTHGFNVSSHITYVGEHRDAWLKNVLAVLPISILVS